MNLGYRNKLFPEESTYTHYRSWIAQTLEFPNTVTVPDSTPQIKHTERLSSQETPLGKK